MSRPCLVPDRPAAATPAPVPRPDAPPVPADTLDILARTLWGEARGQPPRVLEALACMALNRWRREPGATLAAICTDPAQFPCWDLEPGAALALATADASDPAFAMALRVARRALAGTLSDPTGGAWRFHRGGDSPAWAQGLSPLAEVGPFCCYGA